MFNLNQILTLLIPITALIWLSVSIFQLKSKKITSRTFIVYAAMGLIICVVAAFRDGYGFSNTSLIPISSALSTCLSILGLVLFVITGRGIFSKNLNTKVWLFASMIIIFTIKFMLVELVSLGGRL